MFVPILAYTVGTELSYLGFGWDGNSNTPQPYLEVLVFLPILLWNYVFITIDNDDFF